MAAGRSFRRWPAWRTVAAAGLALFVAYAAARAMRQPAERPLREGPCRVLRVVDGDTVIVVQPPDAVQDDPSAVTARLRLLGVDAPELGPPAEPFAEEAKAWLMQQASGKSAYLQLDKRRLDRYGRQLGYLAIEGRLLNEALLRSGLARVFAYPGDSSSLERRFYQAQDAARREGLGLWSRAEATDQPQP